jgi:hypothetical protein
MMPQQLIMAMFWAAFVGVSAARVPPASAIGVVTSKCPVHAAILNPDKVRDNARATAAIMQRDLTVALENTRKFIEHPDAAGRAVASAIGVIDWEAVTARLNDVAPFISTASAEIERISSKAAKCLDLKLHFFASSRGATPNGHKERARRLSTVMPAGTGRVAGICSECPVHAVLLNPVQFVDCLKLSARGAQRSLEAAWIRARNFVEDPETPSRALKSAVDAKRALTGSCDEILQTSIEAFKGLRLGLRNSPDAATGAAKRLTDEDRIWLKQVDTDNDAALAVLTSLVQSKGMCAFAYMVMKFSPMSRGESSWLWFAS